MGGGGGGTHKDGVRQANEMTAAEIEELSVFNAVGGLAAAAVGGIAVFVIGAGATLGVASGAAAVLGARTATPTLFFSRVKLLC